MVGTGKSNADVFGLYELASDGTVLYSRARSEGGLKEPTAEAIARDLFRDIAPEVVRGKIFMTRAYETTTTRGIS